MDYCRNNALRRPCWGREFPHPDSGGQTEGTEAIGRDAVAWPQVFGPKVEIRRESSDRLYFFFDLPSSEALGSVLVLGLWRALSSSGERSFFLRHISRMLLPLASASLATLAASR